MLLAATPLLAQNYRLGPGDLLKISVIELQDVAADYKIDNQGNLNLPYLGLLKVQDKTTMELREEIITKLSERFVNEPQVFVDLLEINWRPISVIGAVNLPGRLKGVNPNINLVEAITLAGGVLENAGDTILVMRTPDSGIPETLKISYQELLIEGKPFLNIPVMAGDTINIPVERPTVISVIGEVNKPGELEFPSSSRVTLLRVLAAAGGFTDYARRNKVSIRRAVDG
jgi:polysaccharide export outer membrane protein